MTITAVNDRDVLLQGAATRNSDPRAGKYISLVPTAEVFHVSTTGTGTPSSIDITAIPVGMSGVVTFSVSSGGTLTGTTDNVRTLTFANAQADSVTITATLTYDGQTYTAQRIITKVADGATGRDGSTGATGNSVGTAFLYQWSTVKPSLPTSTSTFTWANGKNTSYSGTDSWYIDAPANPGTAGIQLWVVSSPVTAAAGTPTSTVQYSSGATMTAYSQNGLNGATGAPGVKSAIVRAYQWGNGPAPTATGSATYTWSTNDYDTLPTTGWSKTKPSAPALGYTLFEASVSLVDSAGSTTSSVDWTKAAIVGIAYMSTQGAQGTSGNSAAFAYTLVDGNSLAATPASSTTSGTDLPTTGTWGETRAWTSQPSVPAANQSVFQSNGVFNASTNQTTWGLPFLSSLRVGSLSAITANMGSINAGNIDLGSGGNSWHVDASGNMWSGAATYAAAPFRASNTGAVTASNLTLTGTSGATVIDPTGLKAGFEAPGTKNSDQTLAALGQNTFRAIAVGSTNTTSLPAGQGFYANGTSMYGAVRSYNVAIIRRSDGYVYDYNTFDVFGQGAVTSGRDATAMANFLNTYGSGYIAVVWSYDEPQGHRLEGGLAQAMYRCGASRAVFGSSQFQYRSAYILVGICGCGEGNGAEAYQGAVANDTNAWCDISFSLVNGALTGVSGSYIPRTLTDYGYVGDLNATNGAPAGTNVGSTAATTVEANANAAKAATDAISADGILSKGEKRDVIQRWNTCDNEWTSLDSQSSSLGVSSTNYDAAHKALSDYLLSLSPVWSDVTQDTPIDSPTWKSKWNTYYDEKQKLINALAAKASTLSTWGGVSGTGKPQDNATYVPPGKGSALNDDPMLEATANNWDMDPGFTLTSGTTAAGAAGTYCVTTGPGGNTARDVLINSKRRFAIDPNKVYSLTANLYAAAGNDRNMYIFVEFYDAGGAYVGSASTGWGGTKSGYVFGDRPPTNTWSRQGGQFGPGTGRAIPANVRSAVVGAWAQYSGAGTSSVEQGVQDIRLEAVVTQSLIDPNFTNSLSDKLSKGAGGIMNGPVTLQTNGAIQVGSAVWNTGQTATGTGIVISPAGIAGMKNGGATFYITNDGTAVFGGSLNAASGSFGAVSVASGGSISSGQTAYNTGTGWWLGGSTNAQFSMKTANGSTFLCDPANNVLSMSGVSMSNFTVPSLGMTFTDNLFTSKGNTSTSVSMGSATANVTNATGAVSYSWSLDYAITDPDGSVPIVSLSGETTATCSLTGRAPTNTAIVYSLKCVVVDSNNMTKTLSIKKRCQFGTAV